MCWWVRQIDSPTDCVCMQTLKVEFLTYGKFDVVKVIAYNHAAKEVYVLDDLVE